MPGADRGGYSRAFQAFVADPGDLSGLVGYALYKQNIRQRMAAGQAVPVPVERDPSPTEMTAYRAQADQLLDAFGAEAVWRAVPGITEGAIAQAQQETRVAILAELRARTGFVPAVVTGVVVWLVTVAMTVLLALAEPDWVHNLVAHVGKAG